MQRPDWKGMQLSGGMNFRFTEKEEVSLKSNLGIKCYIKLKVNLCLRIISRNSLDDYRIWDKRVWMLKKTHKSSLGWVLELDKYKEI